MELQVSQRKRILEASLLCLEKLDTAEEIVSYQEGIYDARLSRNVAFYVSNHGLAALLMSWYFPASRTRKFEPSRGVSRRHEQTQEATIDEVSSMRINFRYMQWCRAGRGRPTLCAARESLLYQRELVCSCLKREYQIGIVFTIHVDFIEHWKISNLDWTCGMRHFAGLNLLVAQPVSGPSAVARQDSSNLLNFCVRFWWMRTVCACMHGRPLALVGCSSQAGQAASAISSAGAAEPSLLVMIWIRVSLPKAKLDPARPTWVSLG